ncbi:MAG: M28 family peptidase [Chitinophagaceae bacterium]|nr:MAG: M28 family peptidase [Chitinophagaceae bacterium]
MRIFVLTLGSVCLALFSHAQSASVQQINTIVTPEAGLQPLHFLAADELKGRSPKRPEIDVAAKYISDDLKKSGVKEIDGATGYYQSFSLMSATPAQEGSLQVNDKSFSIGDDLLQIGGKDAGLSAPIVFANFGSVADLNKLDVKGKIVVTNLGINDSSNVREGFANVRAKHDAVLQKGGVALIEIFRQKDVPWTAVQAHFGAERSVSKEDSIPVFLLNSVDETFMKSLVAAPKATLKTSGNSVRNLPAKNVLGWIEGTDSKLKEQYIVLSAHYDHIGVATTPQTEGGVTDSIYNGARDNAIGVTAVMNAARYFGKHPPKRSVLFILYTAEEMGLLGSRYFSDNPLVPIKKIVYNLNCDNGGYNDTSLVTIIGLGRTSADDDIKAAAAAYGVKATPDPVPELNLFDRSDNLNLAIKGVPAPTFGMGITGFDSVIRKRYHQLADDVASFDQRYALVYVRSYVLAAKNIADNPKQAMWIKGDKYEAAWKQLYTAD